MKTLAIVIPVYNEQERLVKTFKALTKLQLPRGLKLDKVIFVDDGSTDLSTSEITKFIARNKKKISCQLIINKKNNGRGYVLRQGIALSQSDFTLYCDVDMSTPFSELNKFNKHMQLGKPVIIGTRKNGISTVVKHQPLYREILGRLYTKLSNVILGTSVTDFTCGFKAFSFDAKVELLKNTKMDRWGFDAEIIYLAARNQYAIVEIPVVWSDDSRSKVNIWRDIPISFYELILIRINELTDLYSSLKTNTRIAPVLEFVRNIKTYLF